MNCVSHFFGVFDNKGKSRQEKKHKNLNFLHSTGNEAEFHFELFLKNQFMCFQKLFISNEVKAFGAESPFCPMRKLYRVTRLDCRRESHPDTSASSSPSEKEKSQMQKRNERAEMDVFGKQVGKRLWIVQSDWSSGTQHWPIGDNLQ